MAELNQALGFIGLVVIAVGLLARVFSQRFVAAPLAAMAGGIVLGPVTGLLDPASWPALEAIIEQAARFTLAFSLTQIAIRLPPGIFGTLKRTLTMLLGGVMLWSWLVATLFVWWLLDLPFWVSCLIGAVLTPTDPVAASAVVEGDIARARIPKSLRFSLAAESGMNDGLALAFVLLPVVVLAEGLAAVPREWLARAVLWEVGAAVLLGALIGRAAGWAWNATDRQHRLEAPTTAAYALALGLVVLGMGKMIGSDDILAVFVAAVVFDRRVRADHDEEERIEEAVSRFITLPIFVVLGAALPIQAWSRMGWRLLVVALAVLLLRRLPAVLAMARWSPELRTAADKLFLGWFGPLGVGSIFYAQVATRRLGEDAVWEVSSLVIAMSVLLHGATAPWAARRFPQAQEG